MRDDQRRGHFRGGDSSCQMSSLQPQLSVPDILHEIFLCCGEEVEGVRTNEREGEQARKRVSASELYKARGYSVQHEWLGDTVSIKLQYLIWRGDVVETSTDRAQP